MVRDFVFAALSCAGSAAFVAIDFLLYMIATRVAMIQHSAAWMRGE
jgi:hypothetical protein